MRSLNPEGAQIDCYKGFVKGESTIGESGRSVTLIDQEDSQLMTVDSLHPRNNITKTRASILTYDTSWKKTREVLSNPFDESLD
jgi:gluconate kinase